MASNALLFVYGTLKRGGELHAELKSQGSRFIGTGRIKGRLFRISGESYPGALPVSGREYIQGELYKLEQPRVALKKLDDIEGCNEGLFVRKRVDAWVGNKKVRAWTYFYGRHANTSRRIPSGSFRVKTAVRKRAAG
jgi:gamma-glutamylcyclotransferase (GGCT)/AIG2-like uncharacterized protein YtfP